MITKNRRKVKEAETVADKIKINPKWDRLTREAAEALNAGMTYGKYKAMRYTPPTPAEEKKTKGGKKDDK